MKLIEKKTEQKLCFKSLGNIFYTSFKKKHNNNQKLYMSSEEPAKRK